MHLLEYVTALVIASSVIFDIYLKDVFVRECELFKLIPKIEYLLSIVHVA